MKRRFMIIAAVAALLALPACGNDEDNADPETPPDVPAESPAGTPDDDADPGPDINGEDGDGDAAGGGEDTTVDVVLADYEIELSQTEFAAGEYTFVVEQQGEQPHALTIEGPGVDESTDTLTELGETAELTVTLEAGTYELWCPVADHRQRGQETTITVS